MRERCAKARSAPRPWRRASLEAWPINHVVADPAEDAIYAAGDGCLYTAAEPAGVYFGTDGGAFFASADEGDSWRCLAQYLPPIYSLETLLVED